MLRLPFLHIYSQRRLAIVTSTSPPLAGVCPLSTTPLPGLPDHIRQDVRLLFVGINPGLRSATVGHHYAGHSNRFWKLLYESNMVSVPLTYQDDWRLPEWGYGLTNIVDRPTSGIHELTSFDYTKGRNLLLKKVYHFQPKMLALLGVTMKKALFPTTLKGESRKTKRKPLPRVGLQNEEFGGAQVFVLPNPSGRNAHYSYHDMLELFLELRDLNQNRQSLYI